MKVKQLIFSVLIALMSLVWASHAYAVNYALDFDGTDDYIDVGDLDLGDDYTVEAWVYVRDSSSRQGIFSTASGSAVGSMTLEVGAGNTGGAVNRIVVGRGDSAATRFETNNNTLTLNAWNHIAYTYTYDGVSTLTLKIYLNGSLVTTLSGGGIQSDNNNSKVIGQGTGGTQFFNGLIDELRIWGDVRTAGEISANYNQGVASDSDNLLAYYKFNSGSSTSLTDSSGNGNTGTLTNMASDDWVSSSTGDTTAPTNQDTVFPSAKTVSEGGTSLSIVSSGTASNEIWIAPPGITNFTAGSTMTTAASGTATSITAPSTPNFYYIYVVDAAGNVSSQSTAILTVGISPNATRNIGNYANNVIVVSPYWQVDASTYSFIAVSHSSLSGMASQIGVTINAINNKGIAYNTAKSFTIQAGITQRVFIVPTNHPNLNSTALPSSVFITGTSDFTYGHVRINPVASHPHLKNGGILTNFAIDQGAGFRDITTLSYWGSVIIETNTTGFAMEFIGDMNDSMTPAVSFRCGSRT